MAIDFVSSSDPRFAELNRGKNNGRFPTPETSASQIALCHTGEDVVQALEGVLKAAKRPTPRSGGHCYEDFVYNNPGGTVIDIRDMNKVSQDPATKRWKCEAGGTIGQVLGDLYKQGNVTITSASCNTVGIGGHWAGGGYGPLLRMYGPACDWVTGVDIVTADAKGNVQLRHVDKTHDSDLLRACRGSGGGNYGIVTAYYCDKLPPAPKEILTGRISFDWANMTPERLHRIFYLYCDYWRTRGMDAETFGLFCIMNLSPVTGANSRFGMSVRYCTPEGTVDNTKVLDEYLQIFDECKPISEITHHSSTPGAEHLPNDEGKGEIVCLAQHNMLKRPWAEATLGGGGGEDGGGGGARGAAAGGAPAALRPLQRQKYKSSYMRESFTVEECAVWIKYLTDGNKYSSGFSVLCNCAGGAANNKARLEDTVHVQRDSVMKLQFILPWRDPAEDAERVKWMDKLYTDLYTVSGDKQHPGTPYPGKRFEGAYINYADSDMARYSYWPQLYWGKNYSFMQSVKKKYDPKNVFHHTLSVKA